MLWCAPCQQLLSPPVPSRLLSRSDALSAHNLRRHVVCRFCRRRERRACTIRLCTRRAASSSSQTRCVQHEPVTCACTTHSSIQAPGDHSKIRFRFLLPGTADTQRVLPVRLHVTRHRQDLEHQAGGKLRLRKHARCQPKVHTMGNESVAEEGAVSQGICACVG